MSPGFRRDRALIGLLALGIAANLWAMGVATGRAYTVPPPIPLHSTLQGWKGTQQPADPGAQAILPHARITAVRYEQTGLPPTDAVVIASRDPNDMHTPERCFIGSGYQIVSEEARDLRVPGPDGGAWTLRRLLIR